MVVSVHLYKLEFVVGRVNSTKTPTSFVGLVFAIVRDENINNTTIYLHESIAIRILNHNKRFDFLRKKNTF